MTVSEYLNKKGIIYSKRDDEAICNCPFCDDTEDKFAINLTSGAFNCYHHNNCGIKGSFWDFQKKLGDTPKQLSGQNNFVSKRKKQFTQPEIEINELSPVCVRYLKKRGFSEKTIKHFKIGSHDKTTLMFPYYKNGNLVNVKYRSIIDKKTMWTEKNAEPTLFNRDKTYGKTLILCEGEFDAAALREYRINAVSIPSGVSHFGWIDTEWDYLETFSEILLCFDNDDAGEQGARNVALKLGVWRCKLVVLPKKDANQCLIDEIPRKDIQKCFDIAIDMKPESLVRTTYFWEEIKELLDKGTDLFGLSTPWESLNDILKGWRGGEVTVWTGYNGAGKSTILNQVFIDAAKKGAKICIYSGEMPPKRYLRWALIQCAGSDNLSQEESWEHLSWMEDKVFIVNVPENIKPEKLLNDFEYAARRYDVTHFIIDSLMTVSFQNEDEYGEQKDFMNELCKFVQTHDVHVHLVAHPRKGSKDTDVPGKVDVKGSSHITDLAHNVIVLSRRDEESKQEARKKRKIPTDAKLYVKKNREFGNLGSIKLMFSEETKSYTEKRENFE